MFLSAIQRQPGHCQAQTQAKIVTKKMRSSLRIFSAHIASNAMEIEVSAPLASRGIINFREYFRFPDPKHPSTSFQPPSEHLQIPAAPPWLPLAPNSCRSLDHPDPKAPPGRLTQHQVLQGDPAADLGEERASAVGAQWLRFSAWRWNRARRTPLAS
jgi:hypothetical protein